MNDPHTHVAADLNLDGAVRNMVSSTFGMAADLPSVVTTGCGSRVSRGNTSRLPEKVTCLACRQYAHGQFLHYAELIEGLSQLPGTNITPADIRQAAQTSREIAERYMGPDDHAPEPSPDQSGS